jgi:hypothetical protein
VSDEARDQAPEQPRDQAREEAARRKRLAEVFGDVLPETTADERDDEARPSEESARDAWFREQRPPHHGG